MRRTPSPALLAPRTLGSLLTLALLATACGKSDAGRSGARPTTVPVIAVGSAAAPTPPATPAGPRPDPAASASCAPVPPGARLLPGVSLARLDDEDTAVDIAELKGDDPLAPRCTGITLLLAVKKNPTDGRSELVATMRNGGTHPVTLVEPGDGSTWGWRSPILTWKVANLDGTPATSPAPDGHMRCGNVNDIDEKEIFTLKPGARRELAGWLGAPYGFADRYLVRLVYENDPLRGLTGVGTPHASDAALALIRKSTPCKVESNAVAVDLR